MGCTKSQPVDGETSSRGRTTVDRTSYGSSHVGVRKKLTRDTTLISVEGWKIIEPDPKEEVLGVESIDFNIAENTVAHHTSEYDITDPEETEEPKLVVRRGQPFDISITFNRPYDKKKDDLKLVFQAGGNPTPSKGTHVELILSDKDEPKQWGAKIKKQSDQVLTVTVFTPPTCYVAKWNFKLDVIKKKDDKKIIFRYNHKDQIYILFNPWCRDDMVFLEGQQEKEEYVLNETGRIYCGTSKNISSKPWMFGQFQGKVLDCCMYILDEAGMSWGVRGNPIPIVRKITAAVNAPDDYGVLVGNWSGDYSDGTSPLSWTGSVKILEQYYDTKESVTYGQCWVFSGVTTTVCRALGIPARSVTNFASAHDTDGSITIDYHFDEGGDAADDMNSDSVWNFHVWNESWMSRPDLPTGYGGWQAVDATPQETSDGVYCCGPAPVLAIKRGEVNLPYDGQFIFAEVNADKVYWSIKPDGTFEKVYIEKKGVGKEISTKNMVDSSREVVTGAYKFIEGSNEERVAVLTANQFGSCRPDVYEKGTEDVQFDLDHSEDVFVGQDFDVILRVKNISTSERTLKTFLAARTMYYTGVSADRVKSQKFDTVLKPQASTEIKMTVKAEDYQGSLKDMCMLQLTCMSRVTETLQAFTNMCDFRLRKPHLQIKAPKAGQVGKKMAFEVSFTNPLAETLTGCAIQVEGPGLQNASQNQTRSCWSKADVYDNSGSDSKKERQTRDCDHLQLETVGGY
ncbi:protein-glutamine gamma-glutamyltransferase K-like [Haliotis rubra]|uniref:protein-glutamine gamma-glutamyltransferase K-like n=1 Tax=Haliotis rubra TaxID=36100 RepID=UPI001EE57266|nr:protein-glutamine gamma-glutamyltransferase K-like [Haliotis rubra]